MSAPKAAPPPASELVARALQHGSLSQAARAHLGKDMTPSQVIERLLGQELYEDALKFTVHVLPVRDAVWWGCLCAWRKVRPEPPELEKEAFRACLRWIQKPDEALRRAAERAADNAGLATAAGCLALAIFVSKGNIAPAELPPVEVPPQLSAQTVLAALRVAAAHEDPAHLQRCYHRYVLLAREPLHRLSSAAPRKAAPMIEGSIASRWGESEASAAPAPMMQPPAAPTTLVPPAAPPTHAPAPTRTPPPPHEGPRHERPKPPPPKKKPKDSKGDEDAWEGLSKLEE